MKRFKSLVFITASMFFAPCVFADDYGMAGCGLGSVVAKEMNWGDDHMQILALTTNGTAGSQTIGITFGTSNCGAAANAAAAKLKKKTAQQVYLRHNLAQVKAEAAKGSGEYVEGLAGLFGCQNQISGNYSEFGSLSQRHHNEIFSSDQADVVRENYLSAMAKDNLVCNG